MISTHSTDVEKDLGKRHVDSGDRTSTWSDSIRGRRSSTQKGRDDLVNEGVCLTDDTESIIFIFLSFKRGKT